VVQNGGGKCAGICSGRILPGGWMSELEDLKYWKNRAENYQLLFDMQKVLSEEYKVMAQHWENRYLSVNEKWHIDRLYLTKGDPHDLA
jgi:hypothetical protein